MPTPLSRLHRASSPAALLIAMLALVVATSATTAYAATKIGTGQIKKGAVTTAKLEKKAVTAPKIKKGAVTSAKIKDGTIQARDLSRATIAQLTTKPAPAPVAFPGKIYTAAVNGAGTTATGVGVTGVAHPSNGEYTVTFAADLTGCATQATINEYTGNPALITARIDPNAPHTVKVDPALTFNDTTGGHWYPSNKPFSLTLFCPAG